MADKSDFPAHFTFSQRSGYEPLPEPMKLGQISNDLRREVFNSVRQFINEIHRAGYFLSRQERCIERILGRFKKIPENQISTHYIDVISDFQSAIIGKEFNLVLDIIEITIEEFSTSVENYQFQLFYELLRQIENLFLKHSAPYYLDTSRRPYHFFPCASREQGEATKKAIETIQDAGMDAATTHLRQAAEHINARQYTDAIADSILAVESVALTVDPKSSTLGSALNSLEKVGLLEREFKQALVKLYEYSNAEPGIRHAKPKRNKDSTDVGLDQAMLMFGACASFAAYLTQKHRQAGGA